MCELKKERYILEEDRVVYKVVRTAAGDPNIFVSVYAPEYRLPTCEVKTKGRLKFYYLNKPVATRSPLGLYCFTSLSAAKALMRGLITQSMKVPRILECKVKKGQKYRVGTDEKVLAFYQLTPIRAFNKRGVEIKPEKEPENE